MLIFEFEEMEDAEAFVSEVKARWGLGGKVFNDGNEANAEALFPWVLYPPVALIDRVWADNDAEAAEIKHRFGLTSDEIAGWRQRFPTPAEWPAELKAKDLASAVHCLAELKVDELASEFGGEFVGT